MLQMTISKCNASALCGVRRADYESRTCVRVTNCQAVIHTGCTRSISMRVHHRASAMAVGTAAPEIHIRWFVWSREVADNRSRQSTWNVSTSACSIVNSRLIKTIDCFQCQTRAHRTQRPHNCQSSDCNETINTAAAGIPEAISASHVFRISLMWSYMHSLHFYSNIQIWVEFRQFSL